LLITYPILSQNPGYKHQGYKVDKPIIPHGVSVAVTLLSVFKFTRPSNPERHLQAAECFGVDISNVKKESAGEVLGEALAGFLIKLGDQSRGLKALGFTNGSIEALVDGTMPQHRVLMLAPGLDKDNSVEREQLTKLFEDSIEY
jgi:hydroxyacid-oxoacid transhydrogenase